MDKSQLRVCLVSTEIFAWGKYGGFGRATRIIGRELVERGVQVTAIVPRRAGQKPVETLDGIRVLGFRFPNLNEVRKCFQEADADIYHSQEPSLSTYLGMKAMPDRKHVVTFRDPRSASDWLTEIRFPSLNSAQVIANWLYEDNFLVRNAVQHSDGNYAAANMLIPLAQSKYRLTQPPEFLPTPVVIPKSVRKAEQPTVCFVSRWDRRKRPHLFFELAKKFPDVRFLAAGQSRDKNWESFLRSEYGPLANVHIYGFVDQFENDTISEILGKSWILVNTSAREGLPNAFVEAAVHRCAILSEQDPDGFASNFGYHARSGDFDVGLNTLLDRDLWKLKGELGYEHAKAVFALEKAIDRHLVLYRNLT